MIDSSIETIKKKLNNKLQPVVLFGAGQIGEMCYFALTQHNIKVDFFCDSSKSKQGKMFCGKKNNFS